MKLSALVESYLARLGALDKIGQDADAIERERILQAAEHAAAEVEARLAEMKDLGARYKAARLTMAAKGKPFPYWSDWLAEQKHNSVMWMADQARNSKATGTANLHTDKEVKNGT